jgi:CBS-domain-containing membrane protein
MINITRRTFIKALIAGFFSTLTIGLLTVLTYKTVLGLFIAGSFGSSMVLLFGFPESPFAQPKNVFFGHLVTALVGVIFVNFIQLPIYISIASAVGFGIFLMIILDVVHPPAGGNPIMVIIGSASFEYLINPIIFGCILILSIAVLVNRFLLKKDYPIKK